MSNITTHITSDKFIKTFSIQWTNRFFSLKITVLLQKKRAVPEPGAGIPGKLKIHGYSASFVLKAIKNGNGSRFL